MTTNQHDGWQKFLQLCRNCHDDMELDDLMNLLLTIDEKQQIATRVLLIKELLLGTKTQRQMSADLELSIAKITRGSNALKSISPELAKFLLLILSE